MVVHPNFHVGNFKAIFSGDLMDNPFEGDLDPTGKDFVSVFGSPNNVVIKVVDRCSAICKSVCIFHTNDYTIIRVSHIRPSGVKKGGQFITSLKERVSLPLFKNDPQKIIEVLNLPKMTFPVLGLQIGIPDQEPQLKPRLPLKFIAFDNDYPKEIKLSDLSDYAQEVTTYYDLRDANRRIDSFTNQIAGLNSIATIPSAMKL